MKVAQNNRLYCRVSCVQTLISHHPHVINSCITFHMIRPNRKVDCFMSRTLAIAANIRTPSHRSICSYYFAHPMSLHLWVPTELVSHHKHTHRKTAFWDFYNKFRFYYTIFQFLVQDIPVFFYNKRMNHIFKFIQINILTVDTDFILEIC